MKRKIFTLLMVMLCLVGITKAQSITLQAQGEEFGKGCLIPVDVYVNSEGKDISTIDLLLGFDSMEYVDFVPTKFFEYFMPPVVEDGSVYAVGFSLGQKLPDGTGKVGTYYFKLNDKGLDGFVGLTFYGTGVTTDSNLNWRGEDLLQIVGKHLTLRYSENLDSCLDDNSDSLITGGFLGIDRNDAVNAVIAQMNDDYGISNFEKFFILHKGLCISLGSALLLVIVLIIILLNQNKRVKGKN